MGEQVEAVGSIPRECNIFFIISGLQSAHPKTDICGILTPKTIQPLQNCLNKKYKTTGLSE